MRNRAVPVLIIVLTLLAPALAGCVGTDGLAPATAMASLATARDAAKHLLHHGSLVEVQGFEPLKRYVEHTDGRVTGEITVHGDDVIGDGRAPLWVFAFANATRTAFVVVLGSNHVLATGWSEAANRAVPSKPIANWTVDSLDAAEVLHKDARWPAPHPNTTVAWGLTMMDGRPLWNVTQQDQPVFPGSVTYALVDAANGTVLQVGHLDEGGVPGAFVQNTTVYANGTVAPGLDVRTPMLPGVPGSTLLATARLNASQLGSLHGPVTLSIRDLNGTVLASGSYAEAGAGVLQARFPVAGHGGWYQAVVSTDQDVRSVQVTLHTGG